MAFPVGGMLAPGGRGGLEELHQHAAVDDDRPPGLSALAVEGTRAQPPAHDSVIHDRDEGRCDLLPHLPGEEGALLRARSGR